MLSLQVFGNSTIFIFTLICFIFFAFSSLYSANGVKQQKGIYFLFVGLTLDFVASWLGYHINLMQNSSVPLSILVFIELFIYLISMIFMALAASQFLVSNIPDVPVILGVSGIGLFAIIYFILIQPDGEMVNNMRRIFPIAGIAYMSGSFWSQSSNKRKGSIFAALITSVCSIYMILMLMGIKLFIVNSIYIPSFLYLSLAVSLLMIKADSVVIELNESKEKIKSYNKKIEEIIRLSPFPILISRLSDDKIMLANNNAVKLFSIPSFEIDRYKLRDFFAEPEARQTLTERLESEKDVQDFEILVKTPTSDTPFWLLASANIIDYNHDIAIYMAFQDITIRKNKENLLKNQAIRDPLTSLYNRRYFEEEVRKLISAAKVDGSNYSVMMVDADHFKRVNDTYGHKIGDKVLIELAATCEKALRENDIVARYGGEEFVIFLSQTNANSAKMVADRLRETISRIVVHADDGSPGTFTVSIGISSSEVSDNIDHLIKTADEALYRAKENGRNRSEIFTSDDLANFKTEEPEKEEKQQSRHPIFDKENEEEISLLDGIQSNHINNE